MAHVREAALEKMAKDLEKNVKAAQASCLCMREASGPLRFSWRRCSGLVVSCLFGVFSLLVRGACVKTKTVAHNRWPCFHADTNGAFLKR